MMDKLIEAFKEGVTSTFVIVLVLAGALFVGYYGSSCTGLVLKILGNTLGVSLVPLGLLQTGACVFLPLCVLFTVAHFIFPSKD